MARTRIPALFMTWLGLQTASAEPPDWSVRVTPYRQVFPALELSQARRPVLDHAGDHVLGNGSGLIALRLRAHRAGERVILSVTLPEHGGVERFAATLAQPDVEYELHPPLDWDIGRLRELGSALATQLDFSIQRDGTAAGEREVAVSLRPLGEALYFVRDGRDSVDLSWIFAAYVDERDAVVDAVLEAAAASGIAGRFDAYAGADPRLVYRQVWAIWQALSVRGIRYSSADPAIERGPNVFSQHVRFLEDTWADRSANCIDGSVLIASVLQRIGIRSFLVLVPGHAFAGFYTDADAQHAAYLETTLLGAQVAAPPGEPDFAADVPPTHENRASLAGYAAALAAGHAHHARVAAKLDGRHRPDYAVIDIPAARAFGIQPILHAADTPPSAEN